MTGIGGKANLRNKLLNKNPMPASAKQHRRRSIRLKGYDYSTPGAYFVTMCANRRKCIFGTINRGRIELSELGRIADRYWSQIPAHFKDVVVDSYIVMPNHAHVIIQILEGENGTRFEDLVPPSLGRIVAYYKYGSTKNINLARGNSDKQIWQRNYYDHIIRGDAELNVYRKYIVENPLKWDLDEYYSPQ